MPSPRISLRTTLLTSLSITTFLFLFYTSSNTSFSLVRYRAITSSPPNPPSSDPFLDEYGEPTISSLASRLLPRLTSLLEAPVSKEVYAAERSSCPQYLELQSNPDQLRGDGDWWRGLSDDIVLEKRRRLVRAVEEGLRVDFGFRWGDNDDEELERFTDNSTFSLFDSSPSRGLVFTGGNANTLGRLLTILRVLRKRLDCQLPVEIWAFPEELRGMRADMKAEIEGLGGVTWREVEMTKKDPKKWKNFQLKGESILRSSFTELLYLDSDNVPVRNPEFLFDDPEYKKTGIALWPDLTKDGPNNAIWRILGMDCVPEHWQIDSGQILVNKLGRNGLNYAALLMTAEMQRDDAFWFRLSGGDKDTFRYAFYALRLSYTPSPVYLSSVGRSVTLEKGHTFCGHTMFQYGLSTSEWSLIPQLSSSFTPPSNHPPPLFVHANLLKHIAWGATSRGSTFSEIKHLDPEIAGTGREGLDRLRGLRTTVWTGRRGMCVDMWIEGDGEGNVKVDNLREAWGGMLSGFEEMWFEEGGMAGGF